MSKKEEKRLKIIEVIADLCIRNGYQGTSMDQVTSETGFSKATIYRYFTSKENCIAEALSHYAKKHSDSLSELVNNADLSLEQKVAVRFERLRELMLNDQFYGCYFQLAYSEFCNKDQSIACICTQYREDRIELITEMLVRHHVADAQLKAVKIELIFSGLLASLPITKNTALIDIAKEMYLKEILESSH